MGQIYAFVVTKEINRKFVCIDIVLIKRCRSIILHLEGDDNMATIQFRTDELTKKQSAALFKHLGITMSDAINLFLRQSILHGGLPFEIKIPNY